MFPLGLRREIIALLCAKALILFAIYQLFFAPLARPEPDGSAMRAHLIAASQRGH
jgi:hypothetical protein